MDSLFRDIGYSLRRLRKSPVFTTIVVLTLALGIGANTAIFTVVNAVLLRALPYRAPNDLVTIIHDYPSLKLEAPISNRRFKEFHEQLTSFSAVAVETGFGANLTGTGDPERVPGSRVSGDWFRALGVAPILGRSIQPDDDVPGQEHVVVLGNGLWRRLFASSPTAVGRSIELNGEQYQIIGVMPSSFKAFFNQNSDFYIPLALPQAQWTRNSEYLQAVARLKPGVTAATAQAELKLFAENIKKANPNGYPPSWSIKLKTLNELATGRIRPVLLVLLGAVGFVLLIACANVANLLLARAAVRIKEIAIRAALGADRMSLIRQLLTESVILAVAGGVIGLLLARASVRSLVALNPNLPQGSEITVDARVMLFTLGVSVITGLLFGLAPALQTSRTNLQETLKDGSRSGTSDMAGRTVRRALVVAEVALSLTLLVGAGLLIRSVAKLQGVDPGFEPKNVLTFNLALPAVKYQTDTSQILFYDQLLPALNAVPGVRAAGLTSVMPFGGGWSTSTLRVDGIVIPPGQNGPWGDIRVVSPRFFEALHIPLKRGRLINDQDRRGAPLVVVIDEQFVKKYFPDTDPIGKRMTFGGNPSQAPDSTWMTVVGVVGHAAHEGLDADPRIQYYLPVAQRGGRFMSVAVSTKGDPNGVVGAMRNAVRSVDPGLPIAQVNTREKMIDGSVGQRKLSMVLLGLFSGIALLLASIGIYGVMSYSVAQRSRELGIRMALGAERWRVLRLVVSQGMGLTALGVAIGLVAAFALTRLLAAQLYGVGATDPATFGTVAGLLIGVALLASLLPALRATRVDPVVALRDE
jgi:putative ABC transport system permease protein